MIFSEELVHFFCEVDLGPIKEKLFFLFPRWDERPYHFGLTGQFRNKCYRIATPRIMYGLFKVYQKVNNIETSASADMRNLLRGTLIKTIEKGKQVFLRDHPNETVLAEKMATVSLVNLHDPENKMVVQGSKILDPNHLHLSDFLKLVMQSAGDPHYSRLMDIHRDEPSYDAIEENIRELTGYGYDVDDILP